ncbi:MAG: hypothetical protein ACRDF7_03295 [Candidatus Limnocylindrales bacterium]
MAPTLALGGLVVAAVLSLVVLFGPFDLGIGAKPGGGGDGRTPNPSIVLTPAPSPEARPPFRGTILFAQAGDVWRITGGTVQRISQTGHDAMPAWSPDGDSIIVVETRQQTSRLACRSELSTYELDYPVLVRMLADGSGRTDVESGLIHEGGDRYSFRWLLQPAVSPDGTTIALLSDDGNPCSSNTVLSHVTLATLPAHGGKVTTLGLADDYPQGHDDPQWSADGTRIAFTYNARSGAVGAPKIAIVTLRSLALRIVISGGYAQPSWSPDMTYLAAVRTTGSGRDIVIVRVRDGAVVARLTADGKSFAPVWAPDDSGIAYLKLTDAGVDLHLLRFAPPAQAAAVPTLMDDIALTTDAAIDPTSRPSWYIPPETVPSHVPAPTPAASVP